MANTTGKLAGEVMTATPTPVYQAGNDEQVLVTFGQATNHGSAADRISLWHSTDATATANALVIWNNRTILPGESIAIEGKLNLQPSDMLIGKSGSAITTLYLTGIVEKRPPRRAT